MTLVLMNYQRADFLYEYRSGKARQLDENRPAGQDKPPVYVPYEALHNLRGFQSVFGVSKAQAAENVIRGSTRGARYAVYCDTILVDFDGDVSVAYAFRDYLKAKGTAFILSHSGGRSIHFAIPCIPIFDVNAAYSVKLWAISHAIGCDPSIYSRNGMFRLHGTKHSKTGINKKILECFRGKAVEVSIVTEEYSDEFRLQSEGNFVNPGVPSIEGFFAQVQSLLSVEPAEGRRYQTLWSLGDSARAGGIPGHVTEGILRIINDQWRNPKPASELERLFNELRLRG